MTSANIEKLRASFRGDLILAEDPRYDSARKVYNAMIDKRPALIALCRDEADVIEGVNFARENKMDLAVRGGGHNAGGLGSCDGGLVLDLSRIRYVRVDPNAATVRVGGGSVWGDVDHATYPFGLAVPTGFISTTGVGGLTLGGGLGYLTRKYGLTIDNLLSADLVLADGRFVVASERENPDLFWAIRGGGGNFGVATSFLFRAHPVQTDYSGPMFWELEQAPEIMKWYREFIMKAPEELNGFFAFLIVPPAPPFPEHLHGRNMCAIVWCYCGALQNAERVFSPIRRDHPAKLDLVGPMPHPTLQSMFDALFPPGLQSYWKADFFREISDQAIDEHVKFGQQLPTMLSTMHLYPINGAAARISNQATAWANRDANFAEVIVGVDPDPANNDKLIPWARDYWAALHPYSSGGAYINFMMDEGEDRVKATYRDNYQRLAGIKAKYDPKNLFHVNQNIRPQSVPAQERRAG